MTHAGQTTIQEEPDVRVLIVGVCRGLDAALRSEGVEVLRFGSPEELLTGVRQARGRACVLCPEVFSAVASTHRFVNRIRIESPFLDIVAWVPDADAEAVRTAMHQGVRDVILESTPEAVVERTLAIVSQQQYLPRLLQHGDSLAERWEFEGMLSRSQSMREIFEICVRTAPTDATVLILGETGTGKELLARAFHRRSEREHPDRMVSINCSAVPENLIDSELFGYERGAFTGAEEAKEGLFRAADGGTLFLDEIGSIPLQVQYRLLRVLQEGTVRPVGSDREVPVDVRVIAATSARLDEAVAAGSFRHDLLYRLDVIRVVVPPLRERPEDILFLFGHFLRALSERHGLPHPEMDDSFLDAFQAYGWPGNVRQLENLTERLLLTHHGRDRLTADDFAQLVAPPHETPEPETDLEATLPDLSRPLADAVQTATDRAEESYLRAALQRTEGRAQATADLAGISRRTLLRKLQRLGIDRTAYRPIPGGST